MPELPELEVTCERLTEALGGRTVRDAKMHDPFVLRTVEPPLDQLIGRALESVHRRSKHVVFDFAGGPRVVVHLMLGGRFHLKTSETFKPHRKRTLLSLTFDDETVLELTEAGTKRRVSVALHADELPERVTRGQDPLADDFTVERLAELLSDGNHQIKTALRDPNRLSGIGNAYSDEILHAAGLSPVRLTSRLTAEDHARLHAAIVDTLHEWIDRIRDRCPEGLPSNQKAWRKDMVVHGRAGEPCAGCGDPVQRISFKDSETFYCPTCQNAGKLLADRRLSRFGIRRPEQSEEPLRDGPDPRESPGKRRNP